MAAAAVLAGVAALPSPAEAQIDRQLAAAWFAEAEVLCAREAGALWGVSLCGPMVFADPVTGEIATNEPVPGAPRPRVLGYANAALEWGDERWSTFVWPMIPDNEADRARLMLHELFHRIQPAVGLYVPSTQGTPDHLDAMEGRYWLRLEWRALAAALAASDSHPAAWAECSTISGAGGRRGWQFGASCCSAGSRTAAGHPPIACHQQAITASSVTREPEGSRTSPDWFWHRRRATAWSRSIPAM